MCVGVSIGVMKCWDNKPVVRCHGSYAAHYVVMLALRGICGKVGVERMGVHNCKLL